MSLLGFQTPTHPTLIMKTTMKLLPPLTQEMAPSPSDPVAAGEATRLNDIRKKVELKMSKVKADQINASQIGATKDRLKDILEIA